MEERICEFCGKAFTPTKPKQRYCEGPHYRICPACGQEYEEKNPNNLGKPPHACCYKCRAILTRRTSLERYGCTAPGNNPEARKKSRQTMMDRYGGEYTLSSPTLKSRCKSTNIKKYGVDNVMKVAEIQQKSMDTQKEKSGGVLGFNQQKSYDARRATVLERYGKEIFCLPEFKYKRQQTWMDKYGVDNPSKSPEIREKMGETMFLHYGVTEAFASPEVRAKAEQTMLERYGVKNAGYSLELMKKAEQTCLDKYGKVARMSKVNDAFAQLLTSEGIQFEQEKFMYNGQVARWFDFCIQDKKIVVEIDPTYTHNCLGNHWDSKGLPKDYHYAKSKLAQEFGYHCIHVFDWDDPHKIINMLKPTRTIQAKDCQIWILNQEASQSFLSSNHMYGNCRGQIFRVGLIKDDELVQIITFGKSTFNRNYDVQVMRIATKAGYEVVGGYSKIFQWVVDNYELSRIIAYCDISKYTGQDYLDMGMTLNHLSPPQEIWSKGKERITANLLRKHGYDRIFHTNHGEGTSNELLMLQNGWLPVYDCGQAVYVYDAR